MHTAPAHPRHHRPQRLSGAAAVGLALLGLAGAPAQAGGISGQGTWESTLLPRDLDGNLATIEAYYDTSLNITWLADAKYAKTSGYDLDGLQTWAAANTWAAGLDINGYTGWRLPTVTDIGNDGCQHSYQGGTDCGRNVNPATGELAHMFYVTLGNKSFCDPAISTVSQCFGPQAGWDSFNTGAFINLPPSPFSAMPLWTGTDYVALGGYAWSFHFHASEQRFDTKGTFFDAWAVHSGDIGVAPVPEPATFGSLLAGLGVLALGRLRRALNRPAP